MSRPPVFPAEQKTRIVLSILAGEITVAEAARQYKVSEQSVGTWKRQFLDAGRAGLAPTAGAKTSSREAQLEREVEELKAALGEATRGAALGPRRPTASRRRSASTTSVMRC
jgi:transposase